MSYIHWFNYYLSILEKNYSKELRMNTESPILTFIENCKFIFKNLEEISPTHRNINLINNIYDILTLRIRTFIEKPNILTIQLYNIELIRFIRKFKSLY